MSRGRRSRDRGYISGNRTISAPTYDEVLVDYLVIAGGGGSGTSANTAYNSGGGGAGGYRTSSGTTGGGGSTMSPLSLNTGISYTITVGSGGATEANGTNSSIAGTGITTVTSTGGGKGGGTVGSGATGGSGGGARGGTGTFLGSAGTANEGFAGGDGTNNGATGGGGGASGVGGSGTGSGASANGGNGGAGITSSISGSSVARGGGGGGGAGSSGTAGTASAGGGAGSNSGVGSSGTANTGGGGGGSRDSANNGSAGGSGVVILRYSNLYTLSIGAGLSYSTQVLNDDKVTTFTGGSGSISLSPAPVTTGDYESIATVLVGSAGASSFTFSNIPQTYKHLQLRIIARTTFNHYDDYLSMRFNGDSGANYTYHGIYAQNATPPAAYGGGNSTILSLQRVAGATAPANTFGIVIADILDYTSANKFKTFKNLGGCENNTQGSVYLHSGVWQNTAAITSVQIFGGNASSTLVQYSHFALYGIRG